MVYDWFNRSEAPQNPEEPQPEQAQEPAVDATASDVDQDALEWARQAYARLKAQQEAQKQAELQADLSADSKAEEPASPTPPEPSLPEPSANSVQTVQISGQSEQVTPPAPSAQGLSLLEQAAAQRAQRQQEQRERAIETPVAPETRSPAAEPDEAAPSLGAFDDDFTWSAEVLAAQGRQLDQISLEEIDWLGRLRRGMEKTRQGFVTQLLDTLGD
ncbi:MAG: signal recognition particle-docking protein FtsY, partial [Cyanobacteria bacterium K_DeepCast_0m_m1_088]|nr:signal recognition particle-docking protein FtsY [Cyanobacteria bacterium K_DeepCast_0m_m1_088]